MRMHELRSVRRCSMSPSALPKLRDRRHDSLSINMFRNQEFTRTQHANGVPLRSSVTVRCTPVATPIDRGVQRVIVAHRIVRERKRFDAYRLERCGHLGGSDA
jgi:hypothetical protein